MLAPQTRGVKAVGVGPIGRPGGGVPNEGYHGVCYVIAEEGLAAKQTEAASRPPEWPVLLAALTQLCHSHTSSSCRLLIAPVV